MRRFLSSLTVLALISGCQTSGEIVSEPSIIPVAGLPMSMQILDFEALPEWKGADVRPALAAFKETCKTFLKEKATDIVSNKLPYGTYKDWQTACRALARLEKQGKGAARGFFEENFVPLAVLSDDEGSKLTAYFEPEVLASRQPKKGLVAIPGIPQDFATLRAADFDPELGDQKFSVQFKDNKLKFYPSRAEITDAPERALGFADPMDVFYLQIQGSGRVVFPKEKAIRAVFAAHNGHEFKSIANHLINTGQIDKSQASMKGIKAWAKEVSPQERDDAMNVNPRYVWFEAKPLKDFKKGPKGAHGVPLTAFGSVAIDPTYYSYGVPLYVDTKRPEKAGDWKGKEWRSLLIAQDTGGAIKGVLRGDVFFGSGTQAGGLASNMNHAAKFWVFLPKSLVERLEKAVSS